MSHGSPSPSKPIVNFEEDGRLSEAACVRLSATTNSTRRHRNEPLLRLFAPSAMCRQAPVWLFAPSAAAPGWRGGRDSGRTHKLHAKEVEALSRYTLLVSDPGSGDLYDVNPNLQ